MPIGPAGASAPTFVADPQDSSTIASIRLSEGLRAVANLRPSDNCGPRTLDDDVTTIDAASAATIDDENLADLSGKLFARDRQPFARGFQLFGNEFRAKSWKSRAKSRKPSSKS